MHRKGKGKKGLKECRQGQLQVIADLEPNIRQDRLCAMHYHDTDFSATCGHALLLSSIEQKGAAKHAMLKRGIHIVPNSVPPLQLCLSCIFRASGAEILTVAVV